jgi:hypothetical protein
MRGIILFAVLVLFVGLGCIQQPVGPEVKCNDSEIGADIYTFGSVTYGALTYVDSCEGDSKVREYYCRGDELQSELHDCPEGYICRGGACIVIPCEDSDEGNDVYVKGTITKGENEYTDYCLDNSVIEYYCANNEINSVVSKCPSGYSCSDGACVYVTCSDTEDGSDVWVAGTVTKDNKSYTDYCLSSEQIVEYYCGDDDKVATKYLDCPSGYSCSDGICVLISECVDSDSGQDRYTRGTITKGTVSYEDYCIDGDTVKEYYCSGNDIYWNYLDCPSGYSCSDGRCVYFGPECHDSDDGEDRYEKGTVTLDSSVYIDYCLDVHTVREYYCSATDDVSYKSLTCPSGYECSNGRCVAGTCSDSDGTDIYTYGHVTKGTSTYYDVCTDSTHVKEYWCDDVIVKTTTYECPTGYECSDGRCVSGCTDTDGGEDIYTYGTVWVGDMAYSDACVLDDDHVRENFCSAGSVAWTTHGCPLGYGCSGGVCVPRCEDSDGGIDHKTSGTTAKGTVEREDECVDIDTVREYYCHGNEIYSTEVDCVGDTNMCDPALGKCFLFT